MVLPNFLIVGAAKAGTTSLHSYLGQHPQVYMSQEKEPRFFALEGEVPNFKGPTQNINRFSVTNLDAYCQLFSGVTGEIAVGEASTLYLHSAKAIARIQHHIPNAKLIIGLRNPADRAFSSYLHLVRDGYETLSFAASLEAEQQRIADNWQPLWFYQQRGFYYQAVKRCCEAFGPDHVKLYLYEDLAANSLDVIQDVYEFLAVDPTFVPDLTRENVSGVPKNQRVQRWLTQESPLKDAIKSFLPKRLRRGLVSRVKQQNTGEKPALPTEMRRQLVDLYREDILRLQALIDRDLTSWLLTPASGGATLRC